MLLACATFPLIWIGGLVTTYDAGMSVPDWPSTYGYNMFAYPWQTWVYGPWDIFIEHGHRLLGAAVGLLTILLALVVWMRDSRRWMSILSLSAIFAVIAQGVLGGLRVNLDATYLARIHGCTGPLFFALTAAMAVFTSRGWRDPRSILHREDARRLHATVCFGPLLSFSQIVLGAHLRHLPHNAHPYAIRAIVVFHLLVAIVLTGFALHMLLQLRALRGDLPGLFWYSLVVLGFILFQIYLGVSTWAVKYGWPIWLPMPDWAAGMTVGAKSRLQTTTVTAHVAMGSLILAAAVALMLRTIRLVRPVEEQGLASPMGATT